MSEAAVALGVTSHLIRRLVQDRTLAAEQLVRGAPWQIRASDLQSDRVLVAIEPRKRPHRDPSQARLPIFSDSSGAAETDRTLPEAGSPRENRRTGRTHPSRLHD